MTDNQTEQFETPPPPPPPVPPAPPAPPEQPHTRWRDRRVGVVTLTVSTAAALVIGGTFGTAAGGLVGYGVGQHNDRPDGLEMVRMHWPEGGSRGYPDRQQIVPPNGELPPGLVPEDSEGSEN